MNLIAKVTTTINAAGYEVWDAMVNPGPIQQVMFGSNVGKVVKAGRMLQYTSFSPLSGVAELTNRYHTVTIELLDAGYQTRVVVTQDRNATEEARAQAQKNWEAVLQSLKKHVED
jgi:hypothetical protein